MLNNGQRHFSLFEAFRNTRTTRGNIDKFISATTSGAIGRTEDSRLVKRPRIGVTPAWYVSTVPTKASKGYGDRINEA